MDEFGDPNTRFTLSFAIEDAGEDLIVGNDTLIVIGAKFIIDHIELEAIGENEIFESGNILVTISGMDLFGEFRAGGGEIFGGTYNGITYDLTQADPDTEIMDQDLVVRDSEGNIIDRYSFAINGIFNKKPFLFKSKTNARINVAFIENVEMPQTMGSLNATLIGDWKRWFIKDGELVDPTDQSNSSVIEDNFERYFFARLFTIGQLN